ncbi:staphylopine-dependent metal ABC transporter substrate-binding lipoprotein [Cohnella thailandensis]|uniref:Nickel ABC transporter, nickel/metallophore periplasmic binding protein n=1 Tax=Cohnella thailandensis TaxID=557557 RepID=A0A841SR24_9BACL|nr:nickel ABC transporter substrate-binding protein [Cohnella thailandensis]MBB6633349.1 nickel ABC transporter, nickel/metallophore periplasmic binding protein [Cohnella thailandensis]MBP1977309.1 nickel transport system substrate-binding protein [Cohnella thailandensis]
MVKKQVVPFLVLVVAALWLAGCSSSANSEKESSANSAASSSARDELVYATAKDINDMNPHLYAGSMPAQGIVYESLVENTAEGIKPLLAESWDISEDGKIYTFRLRPNVTFHDGEPFNAEAVKLNFDAVQSNASKHAWIKLSSMLTETKVIDEYTVQLELSEPYYPALLELSMTRPYVFLSPKDFIDGETKDGVNGYNGTGPYKLTDHKTDQFAVFEANESYWNGAPKLKKITAKVLPAGETTFLALQKGEVDFVFTDDRGADSIDVEAMNKLAESGDFQIVRSEPMNTKMIVANSSKKDSPAADAAVRQAIWHSIDRETIGEAIFNGTESAADTLFSSNVNYANVELQKRDYDLELAEKLLEENGWVGEGIREKDGRKLTMNLYYDVNSSSQKAQAEMIQNAAKNIGIQLELFGEESTSIANRRTTGDYDLLFNQTWGLAYDPQSTIASFTSDSAYRHTTSGIPEAEELYRKIGEVMVSSDEETRKALYQDILTIVHDEAVFIPLTNGSVTIVAPKDLQGISFKQTQFELPFEQMSFSR